MSDLSSQIDELFESLDKPSKKEQIKESNQPKSRRVYVDPHALDSLFDDRPTAHQIHDLVEEVVENVIEEVEAQPEPVVPQVRKTRQERMAEDLSVYFKKTEQVVEEVTPIGDSQRIKLLEDAFAQMRSAQPATLVSGIGASLDSGGGAVWLWDLEDVNIGTPMNGTYPVISDNSVLKYDSATKKWVVGSAEDSGQDLPLSGGTMTGDIIFNTGQTFPGTLELTGGSMSGDIVFNTGQTFPGTLPLTGGAITGDTTYTGSTDGDTNLQTKTSVSALISSSISDGFTFKGTCDITQSLTDNDPVVVAASGNFYINTVAGVAQSTWTGIAGLTIAADQLVIYSGSESRWFAGSVENNTTYLSKTGGTMTGDITMDGTSVINFSNSQTFPSSLTGTFLLKSGGTMTGLLTTDEVEVPSGKTITIKRGSNNTSIGGLDIKGYAPNQVGTLTDIFAVSYGNGTSTGDSINYKGRTDNSNNLQTKASVQALINSSSSTTGNLAEGGVIKSTGGTIDASGSLKIVETGASGSGKLIITNDTNDENIVLKPSGEIDCTAVNCSGNTDVGGTLGVTGVTTLQGDVLLRGSGNVTNVSMSDTAGAGDVKFWKSPDFSSSSNQVAEIRGGATGQIQKGIGINNGNIYFNNSQDQQIAFGGVSSKVLEFVSYGGSDTTTSTPYLTLGNGSIKANKYFNPSSGVALAGDYSAPKLVTVGSSEGLSITDGNIPTSSGQNNLILITSSQVTVDVPLIHSDKLESHKNLRMVNCEDASTSNNGALAFAWNDSTTPNNQAHILFQGAGNTDGSNPSTYTFARDTATNNVADTDRYFSLIAPRGNHAGVKTVFHMPVEGLTPMTDDQLATKGYVDSEISLGNSGSATRSGTVKLTKDRTNTIGGGPLTIAPGNSSNEWGFRVDSADNLNFDSKAGSYSEVIWFTPAGGANFTGAVNFQSSIEMNNSRITGVGTPQASTDVARKGEVDSLRVAIYDAVDASTDYASLKTALLAALAT